VSEPEGVGISGFRDFGISGFRDFGISGFRELMRDEEVYSTLIEISMERIDPLLEVHV